MKMWGRGAVFAAFVLCACQTTSVPPAIASKPEEYKACIAEKRVMAQHEPIRSKLLFDGNASLEQLSDPSYPTQEEREAIASWNRELQQCRPLMLAYYNHFAMTDARYATAYADRVNGIDFASLALYQGKATYGQALQYIATINNRFQASIAGISQEVGARQRAEEEARAAAALAILGAGMQNYGAAIQMQQPQRIQPFTCTRWGNMTTCQ